MSVFLSRPVQRTLRVLHRAGETGIGNTRALYEINGLVNNNLAERFTDPTRTYPSRVRLTGRGREVVKVLILPKGNT